LSTSKEPLSYPRATSWQSRWGTFARGSSGYGRVCRSALPVTGQGVQSVIRTVAGRDSPLER
jgi:hypothetical protein